MATYLQGVTDYIPQYQPFTPNLNFYDTILKTKQNQYDSNWKQLNKIYGQYFYADLTRDDNRKKKDELIKNINFNLQRVAGLDLSLQKNVDQAVQVFTPFYQDQALMKDMAYTKNWNREYARGTGLKKSANEKMQKQYWDAGVQELQYRREEFKNASAEDAMSFSSPTYTSYVNSTELAHDLAKKQGWNVKVSKSDGRYIYTTKNGQQIIEPLRKLFENTIGNDPRVQSVYRTQSYVNRKNYAKSNSEMFGGDENAAEMKYLEDNFNILKRQNQKYYSRLQADADEKNKLITKIEEKYKNKELTVQQAMYLDDLKYNRDINLETLEKIKKEYGEFNSSGNSTGSTNSGFNNPYGDVQTLRRKVDGGMAQMLMRKDLSEAAETEAYRNHEVTMKTDAYGLESVKQANRRSIAKLKGKIQKDNINYKNFLEKENKVNAELEKQGLIRKVVETREYKDMPNGRRIFKDQVDESQWNGPLLKNIAVETIETAKIDPVTGNYIYEDAPTYTDVKMEANTTGGGDVKMDTQERINQETRNQAMSLNAQEKETLSGLSDALEYLANMAGKEGQISEKDYLTISTVNSKGEVVNSREMFDNYGKGDNARQSRNSYFKTRSYLASRVKNGTATEGEKDLYESPLFSAATYNKVQASMFQTKARVKYLQEARVKTNDFSKLTRGAYTPELARHIANNDREAYEKELSKYTVIDNKNWLDKTTETIGWVGDVINWTGNQFGKDGKIIDSQSMLGQWMGVNSNPYDWQNARTAWNKYSSNQDVVLPAWIAENKGSKAHGNAIRGEWATRTVGHPNSITGKEWEEATNIMMRNPNVDFSITGTGQEGFKFSNKKGKGILDALIAFRGEGKDFKNKQFQYAYTPLAKNNLDTEALRINQLPEAFLKSLTGTEKAPGLLTNEELNQLKQNGLYIAMPRGSMNSLELAQASNLDPMDIMIRNSGSSGYTYDDPMGEGSVNIKYNKDNQTYTTTLQTEFLQPVDENGNLNGYARISTQTNITAANWEQYFNTISAEFAQRQAQNAQTWNRDYQSVYEEGPDSPTYQMIRQQINANEYDDKGEIEFSSLPEGQDEISTNRIKD